MKTRLILGFMALLLTSCSGQPLSHLTWLEITLCIGVAALIITMRAVGYWSGLAQAREDHIKELRRAMSWLCDELTASREESASDEVMARLRTRLENLRKLNAESGDAHLEGDER